MATSKKVTELPAIASVANDDVVYVVHDPAGVPTSNKVTVRNLLKSVVEVGAAPASATAAGVKGQMVANGSYLYICTAANTWVRTSTSASW